MAATEGPLGSVIAAALALPGVVMAQAETGPGPAQLSIKTLHYQDWQPGLQRIRVTAPALLLRLPLGQSWGVETGLSTDSVSGASPRYHTAITGASRMSDERRAGDIKVTRYADRSTWSLGAVASKETDFRSRAVSTEGSWTSEDQNRTWTLGLARTEDRIGSRDDPDLHEQRQTNELSVGLTQAMTRQDLVQLTLSLSQGRGFFSDPYKRLDVRPTERRQGVAALRWNHHFEALDITLRSSWRYYTDSFGVRSHTLLMEPVFTPAAGVSLSPTLRLYTQRAASFYFDPVYSYLGAPYPPGYAEAPPKYLSADQRLAAFGALTLGFKIAWQFSGDWSCDLKFERYEQRGDWRIGGPGSPGLAPFSARFVQWGLARRF